MKPMQRFILIAGYLVSVAVGIISVHYNWRTKELRYSKSLQAYMAVQNLLILTLLPFMWHKDLTYNGMYDTNPVTRYITATKLFMEYTTLLLMILLSRYCEPRLLAIVRELMQLERNYFKPLQMDGIAKHMLTQRWKHIEYIFWTRLCTLCTNSLMVTYAMLPIILEAGYFKVGYVYFVLNMVYMMHGVAFHYFAVLCHICKRFYVLNAQLACIKRKLSDIEETGCKTLHSNSATLQELFVLLAGDLRALSVAHVKLMNLLNRLNDTYKVHLLCIVANYFVYNVTGVYYVILLIKRGRNFGLDETNIAMSVFTYFVMFFDIILFDILCDRVANLRLEAVAVLREFREIPARNKEFEQSCEVYALQLLHCKLSVNIIGLFDIDRRASFSTMAQIYLYIICLVQLDYKNL